MTYCSWWWDVAIFLHSGWDDQYLLPYIFRLLEGFPGDLARSLDKDATLTDVLQTLDEHYGVVMIFNTLSKELYSLKQTSGENVAEFGMHLSQRSRYSSQSIQEGSKRSMWRRWNEAISMRGLNLRFRCMSAHKVDGDDLISYSDLLPAAWKLERWNETRDPLLQKTTTTGGSNVTHSQTPVNLFPS